MVTKQKKTKSDSILGIQQTSKVAKSVLVPDLPMDMDEESLFLQICESLPASERTKPATALLLAMMAKDILIIKSCQESIKQNGIVTESHSQRYICPEMKALDMAFKRFMLGYTKLSMSPSQEKHDLHRMVREEVASRGGSPLRMVKAADAPAPNWAELAKKEAAK